MTALSVILTAIITTSIVTGTNGWGYRSSDQRRWTVLYPACGGRQQSPIALEARKAIPVAIPGIELVGYQNPLPGPVVIKNNGHTVAVEAPRFSSDEEKKGFHLPYIHGGPLDNQYEFEGLHFHWGDRNDRGSEHTVNDIRHPLEMHIVHRNKKYSKVAEAIQHPDGMSVIAVFYRVVEDEAPNLEPILSNMTAIERVHSTMQLRDTFSISSLLSGLDTDRFYTYKGSLTTPPCSEAATWIVFAEPLTVSIQHLTNLRSLLANMDVPLADNFRKLQPMYGRRLFVRIHSRSPKFTKNMVQYKWDWNTNNVADTSTHESHE